MCRGRGSASRFRQRRAGHRADGKRRQDARLPHRLEPQPQGVQRGDLPADDGRLHRLPGKRLRHFGGLPKVLVIDNLRAAVKHPDWFDPELVPKLRSFCQHYGIVILPTKPYMPRHKGKVEAGVKYVQNNALKAQEVRQSSASRTSTWRRWEATVADTRIHGTTRQHVGKVFREAERPALQPLPLERFAMFQEAPRKVSRDGHIEVAKAYYSAPPEYLGRTVWARWDKHLVRIFNQRFEQIDLHLRHEPGRFSTHAHHLAPEKINGIERGVGYLLTKVRGIGPDAHQWAEAMLARPRH